nr:VOC family protein [uncultured Cohaesibacter sp.]
MIDHLDVKVSDLAASRRFYALALKPLGYEVILDRERSVSFGVLQGEKKSFDPGGELWLVEGKVSKPLPHFAFSASSRQAVRDFHAAALQAGGRDNGQPGLRPDYHPDYYAAFILDPDGYNIEAVFHKADGV